MSVRQSKAWQQLQAHYDTEMRDCQLYRLFAEDDQRFPKFSLDSGKFLLDYSKHRITSETRQLLFDLLDQQDLAGWTKRLFGGDAINTSENRAALHTALRAPLDLDTVVDGVRVAEGVHASLDKMQTIVERIHSGQWRGFSGKAITDVVNLGVGGSDLGPQMACHALSEFRVPEADDLTLHFVSCIDGSQLAEKLQHLNQETTLFIVSSKSFTTIDTLSNAESARRWLAKKISSDQVIVNQHFIGCSAEPEKMAEQGIPERNQLLFWDWVGGRFSMWSVIGLPIALLIGMQGFRQMLAGAHDIDEQFKTKPYAENMPVLMAVLGFWSSNFLGVKGHSVLPYDGRLKFLPDYLTQLEMESNGKSVNRDGESVDYDTCPILWGEVGPNAQHAFYQLLHQGTQPVSCDFIAPINHYGEAHVEATGDQFRAQHQLTLANCLAQSRVLMMGDHALSEADRANRTQDQKYDGNQVSSTLLMSELNPFTFGALIALYEHKVFVQSVLWEINPFDQWGVELGKKIAIDAYRAIVAENPEGFDDCSTQGLLDFIRKRQS